MIKDERVTHEQNLGKLASELEFLVGGHRL